MDTQHYEKDALNIKLFLTHSDIFIPYNLKCRLSLCYYIIKVVIE